MENELFRKEVADKAASEVLDSYVKTMAPNKWLLILGTAIMVAGMLYFRLSTSFRVIDLLFGIER